RSADSPGPLLSRLPPYLKKDLPRLQDFLGLLPTGREVAFEFRNDSWQDEEVYAALAHRGAILCVTDTDEGDTPFIATAECGSIRLRRTHYADSELDAWAAQSAAKGLPKTYVYFMHEDEALGTRFARRLNEAWAALSR